MNGRGVCLTTTLSDFQKPTTDLKYWFSNDTIHRLRLCRNVELIYRRFKTVIFFSFIHVRCGGDWRPVPIYERIEAADPLSIALIPLRDPSPRTDNEPRLARRTHHSRSQWCTLQPNSVHVRGV